MNYWPNYAFNLKGRLEFIKEVIKEKLNLDIEFYETEFGDHEDSFTKLEMGIKKEESTNPFRFFICEFPGNCSWLMAYHLTLLTEDKLKITELLALLMRYAYVVISLSDDQESVCKFVESIGYEVIHENTNHHSGNRVFLYVKEIK